MVCLSLGFEGESLLAWFMTKWSGILSLVVVLLALSNRTMQSIQFKLSCFKMLIRPSTMSP